MTIALRAALLARVSTVKASQATSARRQLTELRELAARRGWHVAGFACDRLSGGDFRRPGLLAMVDLVVNGRADVLVVHDLDRLGRDCKEMLHTVDALALAGGNLAVRDKNIDTTSAGGRLTFTIFAAVAEFQRRDNRARVIAGLEHARKKGVRLGRPAVVTPAQLARAIALRGRRKTWGEIAADLGGDVGRTTIAWAVRNACKKTPSKAGPKIPEVLGVRGGRRRRVG